MNGAADSCTCMVLAPMLCNSFRRDSSRPVASTRTPRPKRWRMTSKEMLDVAPRMRHDFGEGESALALVVPMQRAPENGNMALEAALQRDLRSMFMTDAAAILRHSHFSKSLAS
jgi:hypothetical protein